MQGNSSIRTILFATVLGVLCSLSLVLVNIQTKPLREANERAEELRNYLFALNAPVSSETSADELLEVFDRLVRIRETEALTYYEYYPGDGTTDSPAAVAVPLSGSGLWGRIEGVLALEPDLKTIKGIRFYKQSETPGLGGEIGSDWFLGQFEGKSIVSPDGEPGITIAKPGEGEGANAVDGISGATMTSERVEIILRDLAETVLRDRGEHE